MKTSLPFAVGAAFLASVGSLFGDTVTVSRQIADSDAEYFRSFPPVGTPDANGWNYGWYNLTTDADSTYQDADFQQFLPGQTRGATGFGLVGSNAPWTLVDQNDLGHPNGTNSTPNEEHWAIRRYTIGGLEAGTGDVNWSLAAQNLGGSGTTIAVFQNGVQIATGTTNAGAGISGTATTPIAAGDVIDFVLTPEGTGGPADRSDGADGSFFGGTIDQTATFNRVAQIADSVADFPTGTNPQGQNDWTYGYYDITTNGQPDPGGGDFIPFPSDGSTTHSAANFWDGSDWDWFAGNPPWTFINAAGGHPNGSNNATEHWATRRFTVPAGEGGDLLVDWALSKNPVGSGTTVHILHNGVIIDGGSTNDTTGVSGFSIVRNAAVGDLIEVALSPVGPNGDTADGNDSSSFSANIHLLGPNAIDDFGSTTEDAILAMVDPGGAEPSLFANDLGTGITLLDFDGVSAEGASVTVNANGTFSYDPTSAPALQSLPLGAPAVCDTFTYSIISGALPLNEDGLMNVRLVDTNGPNPGNSVNNWLNLFNALDALPPGTTGNPIAGFNVRNNIDDTEDQFNYAQRGNFDPTLAINTINNDGPGGGPGPYNGNNDYAIRGETFLRFTAAGTYSIALGSDDGRRIELIEAISGSAPGYGGFTARGDQVSGPFSAGDTVIFRDGGTGHAQSVGVFDVAAGDILFLSAYFYQGGGGHSGEIMIKDSSDLGVPGGNNSHPQAFNDGWRLLQDGVFGIELSSDLLPDATSTATVTVKVDGRNDQPVAGTGSRTTDEDAGIFSQNLVAPDLASDVDTGDTLTITSVTQNVGQSGRDLLGAFVHAGNNVSFDTNLYNDLSVGIPELLVFDYTVEDALGLTASGQLRVTVFGRNDDPNCVDDMGPLFTVSENGFLTVAPRGVLINDTDPDSADGLGLLDFDDTGTLGILNVPTMNGIVPGGVLGDYVDINDGTDLIGNRTGTSDRLFDSLDAFVAPGKSDFVLQRHPISPTGDATGVITPCIDFGNSGGGDASNTVASASACNLTQGNRGGFSSGTEPPWQGLFDLLGVTADMDGDHVGATWCGKIQITTGGTYTFETRSDDGSVLFVNGVRIVVNNKFQGMTNRSGTVDLAPGLHDISIGYYEGGGGAGMQAWYNGPDTGGVRHLMTGAVLFNDVVTAGTFVAGGLRGDYYDFNNPGLNGGFNFNADEWLLNPTSPTDNVVFESLRVAAQQITARIDFGAGTETAPGDGTVLNRGGTNGNPFGGIGVNLGENDQIGAVWEGFLLVPETADFIFTTRSDDHSRVYVDIDNNGDFNGPNELVASKNGGGMANFTNGPVSLTAGPTRIKAVFGEGGGGGGMQVSWEQTTGASPFAREIIPPDNLGSAIAGDGSFTYDPDNNFEFLNVGETATTTFTYDIVDPSGGTSTGTTVTITITGLNDPPTITGSGIPDQCINTSSPTLDVNLFDYFEDVDNDDDEQIYTVTMNTNMGLIQTSAIPSATGILTLTTPCDLIGTADITVEVEDTGGETVSDTFTVEVKDDVPPVLPTKDIFINAPAGGSAFADFSNLVAIDKVDGVIAPISCTPDDLAPFSVAGSPHLIVCEATDSSNNTGMGSFFVHVLEIGVTPGTRMLDVVSIRNDNAPGAGGPEGVPANATILLHNHAFLNNNGDVFYEAALLGAGANNLVLYKNNTPVAVKGAPSPVLGNYGVFDHLAINDTASSFQSRIGFDNAHYTESGGTVTEGNRVNNAAPGTAGSFHVLQKPALSSAGTLVTPASMFLGVGGVTINDDTGIWDDAGNLLAREGSLSPIGGTVNHGQMKLRVVTSPASNQSAYASFLVDTTGFDPSNNAALFAGTLGSETLVVRKGDPAPGTGGSVFSDFLGESVNSSSQVIVRALLAFGGGVGVSNNEGLWSNVGGGPLRLIALEDDIAPCLDTNLVRFDRFTTIWIADDGTVCFHAFLRGPASGPFAVNSTNDGSFWRYDASGGELHLITREGHTAHNTDGAVISLLESLACNNTGGVVFNARLAKNTGDTLLTNDLGVWLDTGPDVAPMLVMRRDDTFDLGGSVRTVENIGFEVLSNPGGGTGGYGRTLNDNGEILLKMTLDGNLSGIFTLQMAP